MDVGENVQSNETFAGRPFDRHDIPEKRKNPSNTLNDTNQMFYILFLILYICSFFWFKKSPWKRWLLWAAIIVFFGMGAKNPPETMGALTGIFAFWQAVRWTYILIIRGIRKVADKQDDTWDKTTIYDKKVVVQPWAKSP